MGPCGRAACLACGLVLMSENPWTSSRALGMGTSYESQLVGFMSSALQTLAKGEFAGRGPSQVDASPTRPICRPSDFHDLRAAASDQAAFDELRRRCRLIETKGDDTHVHAVMYLPTGYCETLKNAFDAMLVDQVYGPPRNAHPDDVRFEYKGSLFHASRRALARGARLESKCAADGALRVSAPRKRR